MKGHMKRNVVPRSWAIPKKGLVFVSRPLPRSKFEFGISLICMFRDILDKANNAREVRSILNNNEVLVDGRRRKESKFLVGLMDSLSIPSTNEYFRILINKKGKLVVVPITKGEGNVKLCKIVNKTLYKGKTQLVLHDGRSLLVDKDDYKTGDSILITLPDQKIKEHLKFENGALVYMIGGRSIGNTGTMEKLEGKIIVKAASESFEVVKDHVFVVGKGKPVIALK